MTSNTTPPITLKSVIRQTNNQVEADIDGETAMMSIEKGNYYMLNEVGSRIWKIAAEPTSLEDVAAKIVAEYEVELEQCQSDVINLVHELIEHDLVEVVDKPD